MTRKRIDLGVTGRYFVVASVVATAFLSAYTFAAHRASAASVAPADAVAAGRPSAASSTGGCACCSDGGTAPTAGRATVEGGVQRVNVSAAGGSFAPNEIAVKAGLPIEITFGEGRGCLQQVVFEQFGITKDLTNGGAVVKLPALRPGTYQFRCGMAMQFGSLIAR